MVIESHGRSRKVKEGHGWSLPINGLTFQVRKFIGGGVVVGWWVCGLCRIIVSAPVPVPFLRTLDFGFWTWIWDLDLGQRCKFHNSKIRFISILDRFLRPKSNQYISKFSIILAKQGGGGQTIFFLFFHMKASLIYYRNLSFFFQTPELFQRRIKVCFARILEPLKMGKI